jgi:hypothetical protein
MSRVLVLFLVAMTSVATAEPVSGAATTKVRAYFIGWDVLTRSRLSAEDVIRRKDIFIEINDSGLAENFVEWLRLDDLKSRKSHEPADARLAIEVVHGDGSTDLYYADKAALYTADSTRSRPVDQIFRDRFDVARK